LDLPDGSFDPIDAGFVRKKVFPLAGSFDPSDPGFIRIGVSTLLLGDSTLLSRVRVFSG
jgi:hypothetical protein